MARIWKFIERSSTAVTISQFLGVPTVSGILAAISGYWTNAHAGGPLPAFLIGLIVFVTSLWSGIGLFWLWDRGKPSGRKTPDSSWGLITEGGHIAFNPGNERYCQISVRVKNMNSWPVRVEAERLFVQAGTRLPNQPGTGDFRRIIVHTDGVLTFNLGSYSKEQFPDTPIVSGKIEIVCHYGHPDGGYTRTMRRWLEFDQPNYVALKVPPGFPPPNITVPLNFGPYKDEEDFPYIPNNAHKSSN